VQDGKKPKRWTLKSVAATITSPFPLTLPPILCSTLSSGPSPILRGETTVANTGDFRLHGKNGESTRELVSRAQGRLGANHGRHTSRSKKGEKTSEHSVCDARRESVEFSPGLVIADFSPQELRELESFQEIARKTGRELVAMAKDVYMLHNLQYINGSSLTEGLKSTARSWISRREYGIKRLFSLFMAIDMLSMLRSGIARTLHPVLHFL
jgi:hypothetical protein